MYTKHIIHQGPVLSALGKTALHLLEQRLRGPSTAGAAIETPSPWLEAVVPPRPKALIHDYIRHVGGDPRAYRGYVPPHLFPQWGFPLLGKLLEGAPYPLDRVLNGGCRMEVRAPLPVGEPLHLKARLDNIDDNGTRAILHQRLVTGTASEPEAIVSTIQAIIPLAKRSGPKKDKARVPANSRELDFWSLRPEHGRDFAALTGDVNPIHWLSPYARAAGFRNTILHGYATMARAIEGLARHVWTGDIHALSAVEVRFTRPLTLPSRVGLYTDNDQGLYVGDAPGGPAYMTGHFEHNIS